MLEHLGDEAAVGLGIPRIDAVVVALGLSPSLGRTAGLSSSLSLRSLRAAATAPARAISRLPWHADLHANVPVALRLVAPDALFDRFQRVAAGVAIGIDGPAALAAENLVERQAGPLAEDVPQGHIDAAQSVVEHGP